MARVKRAVNAHKKRRVVLERASGYRGQRSRLYRKAKEQVTHSLVYSYNDHKARKGDFRRLWIQRINAACRQNDLSYSRFIAGLRNSGIDLPLVGNQSSDGLLTKQVAGDISEYYSTPLACIPSYCTKGEGENQDKVQKFFDDFKQKYGEDLSSSYPINGYDLGTVLQKAIEKAGTVDPPSKIAEAMETMGPV